MTYTNIFRIIIVVAIIISVNACSYSFTGASVPSHLKTIAIPLVKDRSGSGEPDMANEFTNELIQKFLDDNNLDVTDKRTADALLECSVSSLQDKLETVSGSGETATQRRLTINVKVLYKDLVKKNTILDKNFSNYVTYSTSGDTFQARKDAIQEVIELITEDILLGVVSNW